jgi:hypothetical protein
LAGFGDRQAEPEMNKEALEAALNKMIQESRWEAVWVPGKTSTLLKKGIVDDPRVRGHLPGRAPAR